MTTDDLPDANIVRDIAKSIPESAWLRIVQTACDIFEQCVSPVTELTSGIGRLIKARFDRLSGIEKVLAAHAIQMAEKKLNAVEVESRVIEDPKTLLEAISGVASETHAELHELWANLLAQELSTGAVHPEIPRILTRLTPADAILLMEINKTTANSWVWRSMMSGARSDPGRSYIGHLLRPKPTVCHAVLEALNLINKDGNGWTITVLGKAFIAAVTEPGSESDSPSDDGRAEDRNKTTADSGAEIGGDDANS